MAQNALPHKLAIALRQIWALASDKCLPLQAHTTDPVHQPIRPWRLERSLALAPLHSMTPYAFQRLQVPARGPSLVCNVRLRIRGRASRFHADLRPLRKDRGEPRGALFTHVVLTASSMHTGGTTARVIHA